MTSVMLPQQNLTDYQVEFPTREGRETNSLPWMDGCLLCYIDGSKMGPKIGYLWFIQLAAHVQQLNIGRHSSIFHAEMNAKIASVGLNLMRGYVNQYTINSDSRAALLALTSITQIFEDCRELRNYSEYFRGRTLRNKVVLRKPL